MYECPCVYVCHVMSDDAGARRESWEPWKWSYRQLGDGNPTVVLCKSKCSQLLNHLSYRLMLSYTLTQKLPGLLKLEGQTFLSGDLSTAYKHWPDSCFPVAGDACIPFIYSKTTWMAEQSGSHLHSFLPLVPLNTVPQATLKKHWPVYFSVPPPPEFRI